MDDSNSFFKKGINFASQAIEKDKEGDLNAAAGLYYRAIEHLIHVSKYEAPDGKIKLSINKKCAEYLTRAENIDKILRSNSSQKSSSGGTKLKEKKSNAKEDSDKEDEEKTKLKSSLQSAIVVERPQVPWDRVVGLEQAKEALKEAVILPVKFPHLFTGNRSPWKGILLYGPPGTGKSFLAKAVATEAKSSTFLSVSSADLVSKWLGESEKLVKTLFTMARENQPSIVFIDEIDSLCSARSENESESARRIKTEFLNQMQGVSSDNNGVLVLAATNIPWVLDTAIRRRFEKRIYIPLPKAAERANMFRSNLGSTECTATNDDFKTLGNMSEGYSGADIAIVVRDALMAPVKKLMSATHFKRVSGVSPADPTKVVNDLLTPCSPGDAGAIEMNWTEVPSEKLKENPVSMFDIKNALQVNKPTVSQGDLEKLEQFTRDFGQEGS